MDETKKTTDSIVSSPDVTASSITPTSAPATQASRSSSAKKTGPSKKKSTGTASKSSGSSGDGLKKLTEKMEKLRIEMNDVSTWTEMIATDISDFLAKASPIPIVATAAAAAAPEKKEESETNVGLFNEMLNCLVEIKGTSFATSSIVIDMYRPVLAIANDIGHITNMLAQDLEMADSRRQQEEENRREFLKVLENLGKRFSKETDKKKNDKADVEGEGKLGTMGWGSGLLALAAGFVVGLAKELGKIFKNVLKMIKESKLGQAVTRFIDNVVMGFERAWSKMKAFRRIMQDRALQFVQRIKELATRLFEPVEKLFAKIKESPFGRKIAEMFDRLSAIGERFVSKFRAGLRLIEESTFFKGIKAAFDGIKNFLASIGTKITSVVNSVKNFFTYVSEAFKPVKEAFENVVKKFDAVRDFVKGVDKAGDSVGIIGKAMNVLKGIWNTITAPFKVFFQLGEALGSLAGKVFGFLGKLMNKLFLPLTIIMGLWDFFKGFTETEGSFGDKFKAGMIGLVDGLIGWALDIPKAIISWIAGALGFTEVEKALDSFSFKTILTDIMNFGEEFFTQFFEGVFYLFDGGIGEIADKLLRFGTEFLMAPLNLLKDVASWAANALGFEGLSKWLDEVDLGQMVYDGIKNVIGMISDFFENAWNNLKGVFDTFVDLFTGKIDFGTFFKKIVAGLIKGLLAPVNTLGKLVGFDITKKALDMLGLSGEGSGSGGGAEVTPAPAAQTAPPATTDAEKRIDAYASTLRPVTALDKRLAMEDRLTPMAVSTGAQLNETSQATQAMKDIAAASNNASVVDASSRTNVTNNNQSVTYGGGLSIPDRTGMIFKASPYGI